MKNTAHRITAAGLALGLFAPMASTARAADKNNKNTWGAAAVVAGVGAVVEASKDRPLNAAVLAAGAAYAYNQYDRAREQERDDRFSTYPVGRTDDRYSRDRTGYDPYNDNDPYGYDRYDSRNRNVPPLRPGARRGTYTGSNGTYRPSNARYNRNTREVSGIVTGTTNNFSRDIKVRLDNGQERTIEVSRDVRVRDSGRDISIHELRKDDVVRVQIERYDARGDLKARRVDVIDRYVRDDRYDRNDPYRNDPYRNDPYDNDPYYSDRDTTRLTGRVSSIDSGENILRVDAGGRRLTVYTDRATLRDRDGGIRLRDLENGDRVVIEGRRDGDRIYATRVTQQ